MSGGENIELRIRCQRVEFYQWTPPTYSVGVTLRDGNGTFVLSSSLTLSTSWATHTIPLDNSALVNIDNWSGFTVDLDPSGCVSLEGDFVRGEFTWVALVFSI